MAKTRAARRAVTVTTGRAAPASDGLRPATPAEVAQSTALRRHDALRNDPVLADLGRLLVRQQGLVAEIAAAVQRARDMGLSWHMIGLVAGTTAEGARRRWGPHEV